jgi:hypothetical protein
MDGWVRLRAFVRAFDCRVRREEIKQDNKLGCGEWMGRFMQPLFAKREEPQPAGSLRRSFFLGYCLLCYLQRYACWLARFCTIPLCLPALSYITTTCEVVLSSVRRHAVRWNSLFARQSECQWGPTKIGVTRRNPGSGAGVGDGYKGQLRPCRSSNSNHDPVELGGHN